MAAPSRRKLILLAAVATPCVLAGLAWMARAPLGVWAVTDYLRRQGVPARLSIDSLTTRGFAGSVTAGPAGDPDLVIEHIEADYSLFPGHRFAPRVSAVRLTGVTLKAAYDGKGLKLGTLQTLVDKALASPAGGPAPSVRFERATLRLTTPAGLAILTGQGLIDEARVQRLALAVAAPRLAQGILSAGEVRGTLTLTGGERLNAQFNLTAATAQAGEATAQAVSLRGSADLPYGRETATLLDGALTVGGSLEAASVAAGTWTAKAATARIDLSGALAGGLTKPRYGGRVALAFGADQAGGGGTLLTAPGVTVASSEAQASFANRAFVATAPLGGRAFARAAQIGMGSEALRLTQISVRGSGPASLNNDGMTADLNGAAEAGGGFSASGARALADRIAPPGVFTAANGALRAGLASWRFEAPAVRATLDNGPVTVRLARPARAAFRDGALTLTAASGPLASSGPSGIAGALRLALTGKNLPRLDLAVARYRIGEAGLDGAGHLTAKGDLAPIMGLDLAADLTLAPGAGGTAVRLARCGPLSFALFQSGPDPLVKDAKMQLCPAAEPLALAGPNRWRAAADLREASASLPAGPAALDGGAVQVRLGGSGAAKPSGTFTVTAARLTDGMAPARFRPLALAGVLNMANDRIAGRIGVSLPGRAGELGGADILHDLPSGAGRAIVPPTVLTFAQDGLQPGDIAPQAGQFVTRAAGTAIVEAQVGWGPMGVGGSARASTTGLDFAAAGGRVIGLKGQVEIPTLMPAIVIAPDQHLTAERFDTVVPVTSIDLRFSMDAQALRIASLTANVAKGTVTLEPLSLPLMPGQTTASVVRASGVELGEIVSSLNLGDSVAIDATVEANLPFSITPEGLRFANGRIAATKPGRLSINRSALTGVSTGGGAATATAEVPGAPAAAPAAAPVPTNAVQDFAYQALENLAFEALDATVESRPMGRLGVVFHVKGRNDPPKTQQARIKVTDLARGTAFDKPIPLPSGTPVDLTLDTSLNFDDLMAAYGRMGRSDGVQP